MNNPSVSVIIPAYNEEKSIEETLGRTNRTMETLGIPYEIIVVDDGSTDHTKFLAERHKATLLTNGTNSGKGHALKRGFESAIGNIIVTIDADGSHQPEEIPKLLKPILNGADVVAGSRFLGSRQGGGSVKKLHILGNRFINFLILLSTKKRITDSQTGFRAFRKRVLQEIELTTKGYDIETELTIKTLRNGFLIQEEPITCERRKDGCSHLNPLTDGLKIFRNIIKASITAKIEHSRSSKMPNKD